MLHYKTIYVICKQTVSCHEKHDIKTFACEPFFEFRFPYGDFPYSLTNKSLCMIRKTPFLDRRRRNFTWSCMNFLATNILGFKKRTYNLFFVELQIMTFVAVIRNIRIQIDLIDILVGNTFKNRNQCFPIVIDST